GRSLTALAALGVRQGHEIEVRASGPHAPEVLSALKALAAEGFGDRAGEAPPAEAPAATPPSRCALRGVPASPGVAIGEARHLVTTPGDVPSGEVINPQAAWAELEAALIATRREVEDIRRVARARVGAEEAAILDAHLLLLEDEELLVHARRLVFADRRHPAAAWQEASEGAAERLRAVGDPYLAERAADIEGVAGRVVAHLVGSHSTPFPEAGIVIATDLTPAETAALDPSLIEAVATARGGPTSHSAILARALGIPSVVGLGPAILEVPDGTMLVVDGDRGLVHIDPGSPLIEEAHHRSEQSQARRATAQRSAAAPASTRDGTRIEVGANLGSVEETATAVETGADAVGLLRTEFLFLGRETPPSEDEQFEIYRQIGEGLGGRPLTIRTLDAGGDKPLPYLPRPAEANPFLGVRGVRLGLDRPDLLRDQLRAIYRVAAGRPVRIMFPMVATLDELLSALRLATEAAGAVGTPRDAAQVGLMVEVPAAALAAQHLAAHADFFSIGTNDLTQYTMAAERGNPHLAHLADALHPAVLRLIRATVAGAFAHGRWVGVCGEVAGDPAATAILVGLGVTELSMSVPAIPLVKEAVRAIDVADARQMADRALEMPSSGAVRELLS
ncbi:MAG: phosphoenolpyruvate--protein phosphotransferase, partial [Acidimicrobiia bacterium]